MKKLAVATAVLAALTSFSSAAFDLEASHGDNKETTIKFHDQIIGGLAGGIEFVGAENLKRHKETTFSLDYKVEMGNAFIMPSFDLTVPSGYSKEYKYIANPAVDGVNGEATYKDSNIAKFGIKGGYAFDNGLYTAARYRYEISDGKGEFSATQGLNSATGNGSHKSKVHRVDLTVGYNVADTVDLSANYIVKRADIDGHLKVEPFGTANGDASAKSQELELKAVLTSFGDLKPYAQYTYKGKTHLKGSGSRDDGMPLSVNEKYKNDNVFKIGVQYSF
ncbi:hypothetical protein IX91_18380 [Vibrio tubiashii ATCC 19109]|uniref:Porin n=1 Tax=Vibrio tubiashii ATCC 19109 TaxID=1051646 RepID=F9TC08_9VIBR|nr:hypothetical protein [Vibrio tubiashii]AIW16068.1 hypothetical protein IX91_18380 [Vibrio tubiashii ATCC 19109]EGU48426.1 hypothetical protein VITU9109_14868 [Vibrio tubiashii ATCC 19109]EIF03594.1 hypothetical protein VT1337_13052 [Vibrio tubiashii NCIMB 1337 = ATCC 19106]MCG9579473.1 hypothetical protein [Vibrio tubiashii]